MKANRKRKGKSVSVQVPPSVCELERLFRSRRVPKVITQAELEDFRQEVDRWLEGPAGRPQFPYPYEKADNLKALVKAGWKAEPGRLGIRFSHTSVYVNDRVEVESSQCAKVMELGDRFTENLEFIIKLASEGNDDALNALDEIGLMLSRNE